MKIGAIEPGAQLRIDGVKHRLLKRTLVNTWQMEDLETGGLSEIPQQEIYEKYLSGCLVIIPKLQRPDGELNVRESIPIGSMSDADKAHVLFKCRFLAAMREREYPGWHAGIIVDGVATTGFDIALREVSSELGKAKPISKTTYYDWRGEFEIHGEDPAQLRRKPRAAPASKDDRARVIAFAVMAQVIELHTGPRRPAGLQPLKPVDVFVIVKNHVDAANEKIKRHNAEALLKSDSQIALIELPRARSTLYDWWKKFSAKDRSTVTKGPDNTRTEYRGGRGPGRPEACLDHVEYDEWHSNIAVFDEEIGCSYGRPWVAWFYCGHAQLPLGFYLGFEERSDLCLTSALRSSILPKAFLGQEYPGMGEYLVWGIPRLMIFDNGMAQHGHTIELLTYELQNRHRFTPARTGWFKPYVEGSFDVVNRGLLELLPGAVLPGVSRKDYDPYEHGCLGIRAFYELFWTWIINFHASGRHTEFGVPRLQVWGESCRQHPPSLISSKRQLDELFWVLRDGTLDHNMDHRGVYYEGLRYYSEEMDYLRKDFGAHTKVAIKTNPADLEFVLVRPRPDAPWFLVQAVDQAYARGRSLLQHQACRRAVREVRARDDVTEWLEAQQRLRFAIGDVLAASKSITANRLAAKYLGIGTQHVTAAIDHDGLVAAEVSGTKSTLIGRPQSLLPDLRQPIEVIRPPSSTELPTFDADLSL